MKKLKKLTLLITVLFIYGCDCPERKLLVSNEAEAYYAKYDSYYTKKDTLYVKKSKVLYVEIDIKEDQYKKTFKNLNTIYIRNGGNIKYIGYMENGSSDREWDGGYIIKQKTNYTIRYAIDSNISKINLINSSKTKASCFFIQSESYIGFPRKSYKSNCFSIKEKELP
jgi:hypothetical protein